MVLGSWAEWFSAVATTFAAVVALWFGVRDPERVRERSLSRGEIRRFARGKAYALRQVEAGLKVSIIPRDDRDDVEDVESSQLVAWASSLGWWQRWWVRVIASWIYGRDLVRRADVVPAHEQEKFLRNALWLSDLVKDAGYVHPRFKSRHRRWLSDPVSVRRVGVLRWAYSLLARV